MVGGVRKTGSQVLSWAHRPLGRRAPRHAVVQQAGPLRIELGAWTTSRPGWISTDVHWRGATYLDGAGPWPVPDSSTAYVYADNVIEHLSLAANRVLLREAHRVLQPGGRIRLVTPDIESLARLYLASPEAAAPLISELRAEGYRVFHQVDVLRFAFQDDGHDAGYLWDMASLSDELYRAGFAEVRRYRSNESDDPELRSMELRVGTSVADIMLIVEACRAAE
jgi:predicted SAM-dependent methyltransferase